MNLLTFTQDDDDESNDMLDEDDELTGLDLEDQLDVLWNRSIV